MIWSDASPPADPERCRSVGNGHSAMQPHLPILRQLHWLPVRQRVAFKVATLVYQALSNMLPTTWLTTTASSSTLRRQNLHCSRISSLELFVDRPQTAELFIKPPKTFLFGQFAQLDQSAVWIDFNSALEILLLTYVLTYLPTKTTASNNNNWSPL